MKKAVVSVAALAAAGVLGVGAAAVAVPAFGGSGGGWGAASGGTTAFGTADCTGTGPARDGSGTGYGWRGRDGNGSGAAGGGYGRGLGGGQGAGEGTDLPAPVPGATISDEVAAELAFMVEEEKLARDVYQLAASLYPDRVFANIARAESTHMSEVQVLLDRYDVADPTEGKAAGQFVDEDLAALYATLADQVRASRDGAVQAGVAVEQADIADLQEALAMDAPSDVDTILGNLLAGSQRHLAAFQRNL